MMTAGAAYNYLEAFSSKRGTFNLTASVKDAASCPLMKPPNELLLEICRLILKVPGFRLLVGNGSFSAYDEHTLMWASRSQDALTMPPVQDFLALLSVNKKYLSQSTFRQETLLDQRRAEEVNKQALIKATIQAELGMVGLLHHSLHLLIAYHTRVNRFSGNRPCFAALQKQKPGFRDSSQRFDSCKHRLQYNKGTGFAQLQSTLRDFSLSLLRSASNQVRSQCFLCDRTSVLCWSTKSRTSRSRSASRGSAVCLIGQEIEHWTEISVKKAIPAGGSTV
jgi:hypothetical protein